MEFGLGSGALKTAAKTGKFSAETTKQIQKAVAGLCFVAGTQVLTANGSENIEDIASGDSVWSMNELTGNEELAIVSDPVARTSNHLRVIVASGDTIYTTDEHPFYVDSSWGKAEDLQIGALLSSYGSNTNSTVAASFRIDTNVLVYNFTVTGNHTYFVSSLEVLVHNNCAQNKISAIAKKYRNFECKECASDIVSALKKEGISGQILDIKTNGSKGMSGNIYSDKMAKNVSTNGTHRAVLVEGKVYDNLNPDGIDFDSWINDLNSPTGYTLEKTDF